MNNNNRKVNNPPLLTIVSTITIVYFLYYLLWRATSTLNPAHYFFSWVLLIAEGFGVFTYFLFSWITQNIDPILPYKRPKNDINVDIFVPTYDEDSETLEATLIGCSKVTYPHKTYVLDDGNRPNIRELAERLKCNYLARPTHEHAKAGNINYALQHSDGEFIVVLDADMVPQPEYLHRTLGYFENEKIALVQLPQEFYNKDSIQHAGNGKSWHEQSLFFRVIQPGKNYSNSAFWCGSPSILRRKALEDIGGVATETITEDIHSTVRLHSRGWKTIFVNEPLAYGIAPQTIRAFLIQRLRWAQGTMQLYSSKESPLWIPGLTLKQRLSYLSSFLAYFESFQKIILISMPILIIGFQIYPMKVGILSFLLHWIPFFILNIISNQLSGRGFFRYFKTEKFNILKTITFIQATFTLISDKALKFHVTPKTLGDTVYRLERQSIRWIMVIFGSLVGSMGFALIELFRRLSNLKDWDVFLIAIFWAGYNALIIFLALMEVLTKKHERKQYRFPVLAKGKILFAGLIYYIEANVVDLSIKGARLQIGDLVPENIGSLQLEIDPKDSREITIPIGKILNRVKLPSGKTQIGVLFPENLGPQRESLFEFLFIHLPKADMITLYHVNKWDPFRILQKIYQ